MRNASRSLPFVIATLALLAATGCGSSFTAATPPGFVKLKDQELYDYRATTADGLVVAVRAIDNDPQGSLGFWVRAVENRMRQNAGYALINERDVTNAQGVKGKELRFGHDEESKPHLYYVTLYVTPSKIFLLEAGGTKDQMQRRSAQLDWSAKNFRIN
jgi:hypothetical protein